MKRIYLTNLLFILLFFSCSSKVDEKLLLKTEYGSPKALLAHLEKDSKTWWIYHKKHIILSSQFNPLDLKGKNISKEFFLEQLSSGEFIALRVSDQHDKEYYKLYTPSESAQKSVHPMVKIDAYNSFMHFLKEGQTLEKFSFTDINGATYTSKNTKGKTVILKTWFIGCAPCIAEMPDLNELVSTYKNREDVVFISLALDKEEALQKFLNKTQFDYAVVAEQKDFINDALGEYSYPTHFIIDKNGIIRKVVNNFEELSLAIESLGI